MIYVKFIALSLLALLLLLALPFTYYTVYYFIKGKRFKLPSSTYRHPSVFRRFFIDFPKRYVMDAYNADPDAFSESGVHLFCGVQGSGKTISVTELLLRMQKKYPKLYVRTNMFYKYEDSVINHWTDIVENENGIYGQIDVLDEIQAWFSSNQSKDFPPEMLAEISQQRKQRKMIVGTAQVFGQVAKPLRMQTTFVYCPITFAGCLTIVRVSRPEFYDDENGRFKRFERVYWFVHSDEIRNSFDTYRKIDSLRKSGFNSRNWNA